MIDRQQRKDNIMGFTEEELMPEKWYPKQKRKEKIMLSKVNDASMDELVCGLLSPVVHKLNKGICITPQSQEHKFLLQLLEKANQ